MELYIITGYSGAGKTIALQAFEDNGFYCIDNLPLEFLVAAMPIESLMHKKCVALGVDVRSGYDISGLVNRITTLRSHAEFPIKIVFLEAQQATIVRRFQETRRKHPLGHLFDLTRAIEEEKNMLLPISTIADTVIQTDNLNSHELRMLIKNITNVNGERRINIMLMSFGFKYGIPLESNYIYDVRSLPNPYFVPALSLLDGTHALVQDYVFSQSVAVDYWMRLVDFATFTVQRAYDEGHAMVTISIGCTGGRHRSVAFIHRLATETFAHKNAIVKHRDMLKDITHVGQ